jgi:transposase
MLQLQLKKQERQQLKEMTTKGKHSARVSTRARILLFLDDGRGELETATLLKIGRTTVWRVAKRYQHAGAPACLFDKLRPGQPKKYSEKDEAEIIALACTKAPKGRQRWTLQLLVEELHKQKRVSNRESVRMILKKVGRSLG